MSTTTETPLDRALLKIKMDDDALMKLSPGLINLQSAVADLQLHDTRGSELDDGLSAQLQQLGTQLFSFQEQLAQLIGANPVSITRTTTSPLESCSSQDLGHLLSSDPSNGLYPASSGTSRIASPKFWDSQCATPSAVNISHLCDMLTDSSAAGQAAAVGSLRSLTSSSSNCCAVVEAGAVPSLVKLMAGSCCTDTQEAASGVLCNLAASCSSTDTQSVLIEAGAVKGAVQVLGSTTDLNLLYQVASLLAELTGDSSRNNNTSRGMVVQQMAAAGAIPLLLSLLSLLQQQHNYATTYSQSATAAAALCCLKALVQMPGNRTVLVASGAAAVIISLIMNTASGDEPLLGQAMAILQQVCKEPASHADIIAAGGVDVLVQLLGSDKATLQEAAADGLASLAASGQTHAVISAAGGVPALINALDNPSDEVQAAAAAALQQLACSKDIRQQIAAAGGIEKLAGLLCRTAADESCKYSPAGSAVLENGSLALQNLVVDPDHCTAAVAVSGLVPALSSLLHHSSSLVVAAAAGCLSNIAWDSEGCAAVAACDGVMQQLVQCLGTSEQQVVVNAVNLVAKLAWEPALCSSLTSAGVIEPLISLLATHSSGGSSSSSSSTSSGSGSSTSSGSSTDMAIALAAVAALQNLTYEETKIRQACIEGGVLPVLSDILQLYCPATGSGRPQQTLLSAVDSPSEQVMMFVLGALYNLALETSNVTAVVESGAVRPLVWLLDSGNQEMSAAAGRVVGKLAVSPFARQAMAECRQQQASKTCAVLAV